MFPSTDTRDDQKMENVRTHSWDTSPDLEVFRLLDGLTLCQKIISGDLPQPPVGSTLDFAIIAAGHGRMTVRMSPAAHHYTLWGVVHGGVIATVCDMACAGAAHPPARGQTGSLQGPQPAIPTAGHHWYWTPDM
jgi:putative intracellular protease/amidase